MSPTYPSFTKTYHHDQYPAIDPTQTLLDCSKKVVIITGGGRGIGKAIAIGFAKAHAKGIALLGRTKSSLENAAAEVRQASDGLTDVHIVTADIMVQSQVTEAMESTIKHFGRVPDVLINNAGGITGLGSLADLDIDEFMEAYDLNLRGPLTVLQTFIRANRQHSPDTPRTVINLPSGLAHVPFAGPAASYGSSKMAMARITEYAHHEMPSWNIFNMQPGVVGTDLARAAGRQGEDAPELPAGFAVWLAAHPDARKLNGKFIWANWDIDEVLDRAEEIEKKDLLTLALKGWSEDTNAEELKSIVARVMKGTNNDAGRKE